MSNNVNIVELEIRIMNQIAYKEESSWGSYGVLPTDFERYADVKFNKYGNMNISGVSQNLQINGVYNLKAEFTGVHPTFGPQYKIIKIWQDVPSTPEQQFNFLKSFVTPMQYEAIKRVYDGQEIVEIFKNETFDYDLVYGFGKYTYELIRERVIKHLEIQQLINEFPELSFNILKRILIKFDENVGLMVEKLKENPYIITTLGGMGFKTADGVALKMGFDMKSPLRIRAAIFHCVREVQNDGDTYINGVKLINTCFELLGLAKKLIKAELDNIPEIIRIEEKFMLKDVFESELIVARKLLTMKKNSNELKFDVEDFINRMENKYKIKLTDQQKQFFYNFVKENVTFLIGFAGTGKSMLQKLAIELFKELKLRYTLLAPTGKASKVLGIYTGEQAFTVHRKAGIGHSREEFDAIAISEDVIVVDESSMCDISLIKILLNKLTNPRARILFIGDPFQLPSVGCGNFLYDSIESKMFLVTMLDNVFRQKEGGILDIVTKVRLGEKFIDDDFSGIKQFGNNCIFVACPQEKMEKGYLYYFKELTEKYGIENVMTLSPTKKGNLGTHAINRNLQIVVNPKIDEDEPEIKRTQDKEEMFFRVDDMVMNTVNTYRMPARNGKPDDTFDIMNGDTGKIVDIDVKEKILFIDYDGVEIITQSADLEKIIHSYCITGHKSQGSAADAVISITDRAHTYQLNANLLYVMWTRPKDFLVILAQPSTINSALKKVANLERNTLLCDILTQSIEIPEEFADEVA
jgi:RecD/TraA family predicted helicase